MGTIVKNGVNYSGSGGQGTNDYDDLINKPSIENVTLNGNKTASDLGLAKAIQYSVLPEPTSERVGQIYQYTGTTTALFTHGYWYECQSTGTGYAWVEISGGGGTDYTAGEGIDITNDVISTKQSEEGDIDEIVDVYPQAGSLVSIVNAFNKGDIYSTEEKMIGQWTDGKPLYQKTVLAPFATTITEGTETSNTTSLGLSNIDVAFISEIFVNNSTWSSIINPNDMWSVNSSPVSVVRCQLKNTNGALSIETVSNRNVYSGKSANVTIKYTKTTDVAISIGEATEYSTDEKVVGTWIDGKPLYQRVVDCGVLSNNMDIIISVSGSSTMDVVDIRGFAKSNGTVMPIPFVHDKSVDSMIAMKFNQSTGINIFSRNNAGIAGYHAYVTIRYTKTTT